MFFWGMYSLTDTAGYYPNQVIPFGNLRVKAYLPAIRRLSQLITSFIAYWHQGIHYVLFA